ncbi:hypothetical protein [Taibaiella helva]|uniref:hypothetical protein n=1 Tax=Taibaiella helva TaxID=2301235 RepID=UPI000E5954A8|nr:hypothetical protein [Taibaiella helva]
MIQYNQLTELGEQQRCNLDKELSEVSKKLERLEERFVMEEITGDMFDKYAGKFKAEQRELEAAIAKAGKRVSNLDQCIQNAIELSSKLATVWDLSDYKGKHELQFLLFPDGIYYNRKTEECRTPKVNEVFSYIADLAMVKAKNKTGNIHFDLNVPGRVEAGGELSNFFADNLLAINDFLKTENFMGL